MLLDIVSIVDDGSHTGDLLLGHLSMLLDIVSIVDDGVLYPIIYYTYNI
jgi:hypothetical protein